MKSLYLSTLLAFCFLFSNQSVLACSCTGPDSFCETINLYEELFGFDNAIVIIGEKVAQEAHGMRVKICKLIKGIETNVEIMVWGDVGHLCRHYTGGIEVGEKLLLLLSRLESDGNSNWGDWASLEKKNDYVLSFCGVHMVYCESGLNSFGLEDEVECIEINPCESNSNENEDCPYKNPECDFENVDFYPNPTTGKVFLSLFGEEKIEFSHKISLFNTVGQEVQKMPFGGSFNSDGLLEISFEGLIPGVYFIELETSFECRNKLVKKILLQY